MEPATAMASYFSLALPMPPLKRLPIEADHRHHICIRPYRYLLLFLKILGRVDDLTA
jgi:hypothetical protein